jgi:hypothetical protein
VVQLIQPYVSGREADRRAHAWIDGLDRSAAVGTRHHVVPRFILARFADRGQVRVRRRTDGAVSLRAIEDLAIRDFYTAVTNDYRLDSSLESLFSVVEGEVARILKHHLDARAFARARPFSTEERATLDTFVALQQVRGMRTRRVIETMTDYTVKLLNQDKLSGADMSEVEFVPHPNDHLKMLGPIADRLEGALKDRSLSVVRLDQPLLVTGDEPVVVISSSPADGLNTFAAENTALLERPGGGWANAESIIMAVSPSAALMYGPSGAWARPFEWRFDAHDAAAFSSAYNEQVMTASIDWVAASPSHPSFLDTPMPPRTGLLRVHDGGSVISEHVNAALARRPIRRVRAADVDEIIVD